MLQPVERHISVRTFQFWIFGVSAAALEEKPHFMPHTQGDFPQDNFYNCLTWIAISSIFAVQVVAPKWFVCHRCSCFIVNMFLQYECFIVSPTPLWKGLLPAILAWYRARYRLCGLQLTVTKTLICFAISLYLPLKVRTCLWVADGG